MSNCAKQLTECEEYTPSGDSKLRCALLLLPPGNSFGMPEYAVGQDFLEGWKAQGSNDENQDAAATAMWITNISMSTEFNVGSTISRTFQSLMSQYRQWTIKNFIRSPTVQALPTSSITCLQPLSHPLRIKKVADFGVDILRSVSN